MAALTFLGLGRTAPEEVHRAVRAGVTVLPGLKTTVLSWLVFLRADSLAKRPRADAMLKVFNAHSSNAENSTPSQGEPQLRHPVVL